MAESGAKVKKTPEYYAERVLVKFDSNTIVHPLDDKRKIQAFRKSATFRDVYTRLRKELKIDNTSPLVIYINTFVPVPSTTLEQMSAFFTKPNENEKRRGYFGVLDLKYAEEDSWG